MSFSKEKAEGPRQLKCTRCRHHGLVVPQKGHAKKCPFTLCKCWKCQLITERTRINALQRQLCRDTEDQSAGMAPFTPEQHIHPGIGPPNSAPQPDPTVQVSPHPTKVFAPRATGPTRDGRARPVSGPPSAESSDQTAPENTLSGPPPSPNPLYWGDYGPANLPLLRLPVRMPSPFPHCSNFLVNMPWYPVPPGLYRGSLSPLMVPPYPPAPLYHPPPEPRPPDSGPVFQPPAPLEFHHQEMLDRHPSTHPPKEEPDEHILSD